MTQRHYGKFRGTVEDNVDLTGRGRIKVSVPGITIGDNGWAWPCVPYAGPGVGFFAMPPKGAGVWVEFEQGDPSHAIYSGFYWDKPLDAPVPPGPLASGVTMLKTDKFTLEIDNNPALPTLKIEIAAGAAVGKAAINVDQSGMTLSAANNKIELQPGFVTINGTSLKIMQ